MVGTVAVVAVCGSDIFDLVFGGWKRSRCKSFNELWIEYGRGASFNDDEKDYHDVRGLFS